MSTKLTKERIVCAAIDAADEHGFEALSMRKLAHRLGVGAMSLYRHIPDKDALLTEMTQHVSSRSLYADLPIDPNASWREKVHAAALCDFRLYQEHPWVLFTFASPRFGAGQDSLTCLNWLMDALLEVAETERAALEMAFAVWAHVQGAALPMVTDDILSQRGSDTIVEAVIDIISDGTTTSTPLPPHLAELTGRNDLSDILRGEQLMRAGVDALCDGFEAQAHQRT